MDKAVRLDRLSISFGGINALDRVTFDVPADTIFGLIGPNGAGKTTLLNCISSIYSPPPGAVFIHNKDVAYIKPANLIRQGVARTFQNLAIFQGLTVIENILIGMYHINTSNVLSYLLATTNAKNTHRTQHAVAERLIDSLELTQYRQYPIGTLPLALQRRAELARALAANPSILLLDEPAAGLAIGEVDRLTQLLKELRCEYHLTIIVIEHNTRFIFNTCSRVAVLNFGRLIACNTPAAIVQNLEVRKAYLGG